MEFSFAWDKDGPLTLWLRGRAFRDDPSSVDDLDPVGDASRSTALRVFARVEGR
jgi:hypothetical protein